jgi:hypothetical protein
LILACARAEYRHRDGDPQGARADLDALLLDPLVARHPSLQRALTSQRWLAGADIDTEDIAKLTDEFQRDRMRRPTRISDMGICQAIGRYHVKHQDWTKAYDAYLQAVEAGKEIRRALADPALQLEFDETQAPFVAEVNECGGQLGLAGFAEPFQESAVERDARERLPIALKRQQSKRWLKRAGVVAACNLLVLAGLFALTIVQAFLGALSLQATPERSTLMLFFVLALVSNLLFMLAAVVFSFLSLVFGRFSPSLRTGFGQTMFLFAVCPWLITIALSFAGWLQTPLP